MKDKPISSLDVSKICFGCEPLGGTDWGEVDLNKIDEAIQLSLSLGVNFFDTADVYGLGNSEKRLSKALGQKRHDVIIATKGGVSWESSSKNNRAKTRLNGSPKYIKSALEGSLRRLNLDTIPLYYLHWPDPNTDLRKSFETLEELRNKGKIKFIGCSNLNHKQLELASSVSKISIIQLHLNYLRGPIDSKIKKSCDKNNIEIVAYGPLAQGLLTGKYNKNSEFSLNDRRSRLPEFIGTKFKKNLKIVEKLKEESLKRNITLSEMALEWVLNQHRVISAISGIKSPEQIEENSLILKRL